MRHERHNRPGLQHAAPEVDAKGEGENQGDRIEPGKSKRRHRTGYQQPGQRWCRMSAPENGRRRPAGAASKSSGRADQDHDADARIVAHRAAELGGQSPREIVWTDADVARLLAFMAECEQEERS